MIRMPLIKNFFSFCFISLIIGNGCNTISDNSMQPEVKFTQPAQKKTFKVDSILIFNEKENHVVNFEGTRIRTLEEENSITTDTTPVYSRITNINDTILTVNGKVYGKAEFKKEDVNGWKTLLKYIKGIPYTNFTAQIIFNQLSADEQIEIMARDTLTELPDTNKSTIVNALNELLDSLNLYQKHKDEIENEIFILYYIDSLNKEVERLVEKSIFLDPSGVVNPDLNDFQKEDIRWLNWTILVRYIDNEDNAVDFGKVFKRYPSAGRVYSMLFQQGSSQNTIHEEEILRFIQINAKGSSQLAYLDKNGFTIPSKTNISSYPYMCDTSWTSTQLFWWPDVPFIAGKDIPSLLLPGTALLKYRGFSTDTANIDSIWSYDLNLYYPLGGELLMTGDPTRIIGTIMVTAGFQKVKGIGEFFEFEGTFTSWNTEIDIQAIDDKGNISKYKEKCFLNRNNDTFNHNR